MNKKIKKILTILLLVMSLLVSCNTVSNASNDVEFSWKNIWNLSKNFIENGKDGANYINSGKLEGLVGRCWNYFNNYWCSYCFSWNFSNRYTIYDGNTRRGCKIKSKTSRISSSRSCYTRSLGNLEFNINIFGWNNTITKEED